ncbi:MAG: hypothetical protein ABJA98_03985 [Acidobacteriota bacterium]
MPSQRSAGSPRQATFNLAAIGSGVADWLRRPIVSASLLLTALTVMLTWPQALHLGSYVAPYPDPRLSIWRLSWLAHALKVGDMSRLFDGNIFYPNPGSFAYSDATFLEGLIAAPWLWAHVNPVAVYNVLLLAGIVSSGIGMFVLVQYLTGDADTALVSAAIFTLVPYRVEHFMHLELQWTVWMPLSMWAVHRAFDRGSLRFGQLAGLFLALQVLSCVYYGVFLGVIVSALALLLAMTRPDRALRGMRTLLLGCVIPAVVTALYSQPYIANAKRLGPRSQSEITQFSAQAISYITAPPENWLWGWTAWRFEGNELHLFQGVVVIALAAAALILRPGRLAWIYAALAALSIEMSLGLNGWLYSWLYVHVPALSGFRAPARFSILACCALAVLSGFGFQALQRLVPSARSRRVLFIATLVAIGLEFGSAPLRLERLSTDVPDGYKFLRTVYPSVIVELPFEDWELAPDFEYWSTYHWNPLVNGYSGYHPRSYMETAEKMRTFPDQSSIDRLTELGVRYVVVHEYYYKPKTITTLMTAIAERADLIPVGRFRGIVGSMQVFELKR